MPELPEVETYRARLEPRLVGRRFDRVRIQDQRLTLPLDPAEVEAELSGERVAAVERRGKYLVIRFDSGLALVVHLRMTGGFPTEPATHERAVIDLDDGTGVSYRDVRRFGTWHVLRPEELDAYLALRLGPEPLGPRFTARFLVGCLGRRRAPLKAVLLDQRVVAGLGNIYADEALWHARLHPLRPALELGAEEIAALRRGIRLALRRGIARQGADLGDGAYSGGAMQEEFRVYGRAGEPCRRCGATIEKTRVAGRGTHYCPSCQR
ncbi:MAG TPA: bifunctional DNA-formamidopyrimidine glycosylase/DNA-(apurinic or apyrimidinic site) lyase [Gaiellaceae bacterium]|nr:bifunctional DNA-formamidopyrimidine glycosylase/DNA-(apurinic or apyrimidinic site) lyase [Gaiellaceae bacterium]